MRKLILALATMVVAGVAQAQTQNSTTNCNVVGSNVNCNTTTQTNPGIDWNGHSQQQQEINRQNQENINRSMENLGRAIAADRERRRQRKEAEQLQAQASAERSQQEAEQTAQQARQDTVLKAMQAAIARDNAPLPPSPKEPPVLLTCKIGSYSTSVALYEKAARVDVTEIGVTKARVATFTPEAVSWSGSVWRTAVSRLDMSLISVGVLPEMAGAQVTGTCSLAERKF